MSAVHHPFRGLARLQAPAQPVRPRGDANPPFVVDELTGRIELSIFLLPGFDLWDLAITEEIVAIFNRQPHRYRFEIGIRSVCDGQVTASCGAELAAGASRSTVPNLLILGGQVAEVDQYAPWRFRLGRAVYDSTRVFSAAGGTFALAAAGLLDGTAAAAPWWSVAAWHALAPNVRFAPTDWMEGGKFHTCLGGGALPRLLLRCMSRQFGVAVAATVARGLNIDIPAQASQAECWNGVPAHRPPALRTAVRAMLCNLDASLDTSEICAAAGVSERTLQRLFRRHLQATICTYYRACRLEHARELLRLTSHSITEIALSAGFESPTHFSQCYRRHFGLPPRRDRQANRL
jgi:transcriptional regulator GlxA family with amidase domain